MLTDDALNNLPNIRHGFFTRQGGVSTGLYGSLNCGLGSNDALETVRANRAIAAKQFGVEAGQLVTMFQVHGANVAVVTKPWTDIDAPDVDGVVTNQPGIMLGALAADCAPLLFADAEAGVIGACHAGWKGALAGVAQETVKAMEGLGADRSRVIAAIGPCISFQSYEVGPEFRAPFMVQDEANAAFFAKGDRADRERFDLRGYLVHRLTGFGLQTIAPSPHDTLNEDERFFSYRRSCHRQEPDYGRNLSAIMLEA